MKIPAIDDERAIQHLLDLLAIEGLSGREGRVAEAVTEKLVAAGCDPAWIRTDTANEKIPGDYEIGNLIVQLPGTVVGERLMFSSHMDTVPVTKGAIPERVGNRIVSQEGVGLGADNRTAVAALVVIAETLLTQNIDHPPVTLLFTVGEEVGLWGARFVEPADLGHPCMCYNYDSGDPNELCTGAIGADRWELDIHGISSHAGVHPEDGVSAVLIAARGIADMAAKGVFGKIDHDGRFATANAGIVRGGQATNEVTREVYVKGESRSHDAAFLAEVTATIKQCFEDAARSVTNSRNECGRIEWRCQNDYQSFSIPDEAPVVQRAIEVGKQLGLRPFTYSTDGGLDANYLNLKGIPTVTLGAGQHGAHTIDEYADVDEYLKGCAFGLALASA